MGQCMFIIILLFIMSHGSFIYCMDSIDEGTMIYNAIVDNNIESLKRVINSKNKEAYLSNTLGLTPFRLACNLKRSEIAEYLIDNNAHEGYSGYLIQDICKWGLTNIVYKLFLLGYDINARNYNGRTPIYFAASENHVGLVHLLIKLGADIDYESPHGEIPLSWAKADSLRILIEEGSNINKTDKGQASILYEAVIKERVPNIIILIDFGADISVNISTHEHTNIVAVAIEMREKLKDLVADLVKKVENFKRAYNNFEYQELEEILANHYINLDMKINLDSKNSNNSGNSLLGVAVLNNNIEKIVWLLDNKASVFIKNYDKETVLDLAQNYKKKYYNLLRRFHSIKHELIVAFQNKNEHRVKFLLLLLPQLVNCRLDKDNNTALHLAVAYNFTGSISLILLLDCKTVDLKNISNDTALDLAVKFNHNNLIPFLDMAYSKKFGIVCN